MPPKVTKITRTRGAIPQKQYRIPILEALLEKGGKPTQGEIFEIIEQKMGKDFGDVYNLQLTKGAYGISIENDSVEVTAPRDVDGLVHFRNWLREGLRDKLTNFSETLSSEVEVEYNKLYIRSQKTKWASCSSKGNLSFNLRAGILPKELMEHIVLHELIHLKEGKHNKEFWELIGKYHPNYEEKEKSLVKYWFLAHKNKPWNKIIMN